MIGLIEKECVQNGWIDHEEMMNLTVIAESTPGPIALNCATYIGYKKEGLIGAIVATIGIILPAFTIIFLISKVFTQFLEIKWINDALKGIKIAVSFIIINAGCNMFQKMKKQKKNVYIILVSCLVMLMVLWFKLPISSVYIMLLFGFLNMAMTLKGGKRK